MRGDWGALSRRAKNGAEVPVWGGYLGPRAGMLRKLNDLPIHGRPTANRQTAPTRIALPPKLANHQTSVCRPD